MDSVSVLQAGHNFCEPLASRSNPTYVSTTKKVWILQENVQEQVQSTWACQNIARKQAEREDRGRRLRWGAAEYDSNHNSHDDIATRNDKSHLSGKVVSSKVA